MSPNQYNTLLSRVTETEALVRQVLQRLNTVGATIVADLTTLSAQVQANTNAEASAVLLLNQLSVLLKGVATDPVKVQALADELSASAASLGAAIVANTPAA